MVSGVHVKGQSELLFVVEAGDPLGGALGCGQRRQQHASEDSDDGHHHEEFDQREAVFGFRGCVRDHGLEWKDHRENAALLERAFRRN